jgi:hypothetical protein
LQDILPSNGLAVRCGSIDLPVSLDAGGHCFIGKDIPLALFLTEYAALARDSYDYAAAAGMEPSIAEQAITVTAGSTQSVAFNEQTSIVMVHAQEATCLAWGTAPTATTAKQRMAAGETRFVGVPRGKSFKVACIAGA